MIALRSGPSGVERMAGDSRYFLLSLSLSLAMSDWREIERERVNDDNHETQNFIFTSTKNISIYIYIKYYKVLYIDYSVLEELAPTHVSVRVK